MERLYRAFPLEEKLHIQKYYDFSDDTESDLSGKEGGRLSNHIHNETKRNSYLAKRAKASFKTKHKKLYCEACDFGFKVEKYGEYTESCIQAHHDVIHVKNMKEERLTHISEFRMVCANCHSVLHKTEKSVDELAKIVRTKKCAGVSIPAPAESNSGLDFAATPTQDKCSTGKQ